VRTNAGPQGVKQFSPMRGREERRSAGDPQAAERIRSSKH
jgi:hypothetical protein